MSKPSSSHSQDETYIKWALWRDSACRVQMLPHSEVSSKNFFLLFPWVESVFMQRSGAHLVLQGNYTPRKLFHGREETSACLPSETWKKEKINLIFLALHRRTLTDGNIGFLFKNKGSLCSFKLYATAKSLVAVIFQ